MAKTPEQPDTTDATGDDVSPFDREEFLEANRKNREKARAAAVKKAARKGEAVAPSADEDGAADDTEVDPSRVPGRVATAAGRNRLVPILAALLAVFVVATVVFASLYATKDDGGLGPDSGLGEQALSSAKTYAVDLVSYSAGDYEQLDERIRSISTPEFAERYIESSSDGRLGNDEAEAVSKGTALDAGLRSISPEQAVVLVALEQKVISPQLPEAGEEGVDYLRAMLMTLDRDGDRWVISDLDLL